MCLFHSAMPSEGQPRLLYKTFSCREKRGEEPEVSGWSRKRREHGLELLQRDQPEIRPARAEVGYQEAASRSHQGGWTRTRLAIPSLALPSRSRGHRRVHHQAPRRGPPAVALAQELWLEAL